MLDITFFTDALSRIGLGGYSSEGHWYKDSWHNFDLFHADNRVIVWKELVAIFVVFYALKEFLKRETVHMYTDNEACKYKITNMQSKLARPDLQLIINETCKICIEFEIFL